MEFKDGVNLKGLNPVMRPVLIAAERIWRDHGRDKGVCITEALGGVHSAASFHYYGCALDFRTHYFDQQVIRAVHRELKAALPDYDIILHKTHIHAEPGDALAAQVGLI